MWKYVDLCEIWVCFSFSLNSTIPVWFGISTQFTWSPSRVCVYMFALKWSDSPKPNKPFSCIHNANIEIRNEEMTVGLCHSHHSNGKNSHRAAFAITQTTLYTALHHVELISTTFRPFCNSQTSSQIMTVQMFFFRHLQSSFCLSASMFFKPIHT